MGTPVHLLPTKHCIARLAALSSPFLPVTGIFLHYLTAAAGLLQRGSLSHLKEPGRSLSFVLVRWYPGSTVVSVSWASGPRCVYANCFFFSFHSFFFLCRVTSPNWSEGKERVCLSASGYSAQRLRCWGSGSSCCFEWIFFFCFAILFLKTLLKASWLHWIAFLEISPAWLHAWIGCLDVDVPSLAQIWISLLGAQLFDCSISWILLKGREYDNSFLSSLILHFLAGSEL